MGCYSILLGYCLGRVLISNSCKQNRFYRKWRTIYAYAIKSYSRGYYPCSVYNFCFGMFQRRDSALESPCRIYLPCYGGLFCFYEVMVVVRIIQKELHLILMQLFSYFNLNCYQLSTNNSLYYFIFFKHPLYFIKGII